MSTNLTQQNLRASDWANLVATGLSVSGAFAIHKFAAQHGITMLNQVMYLFVLVVLTWSGGMFLNKKVFNEAKREFMRRFAFELAIVGTWMETYYDANNPPLSPVFDSRRTASETVTGDHNVTLPSIHRSRIHLHFQQPL